MSGSDGSDVNDENLADETKKPPDANESKITKEKRLQAKKTPSIARKRKTTKNSVDEAETPKATNIDEIIDSEDSDINAENLAAEAKKPKVNVSKSAKARKAPSSAKKRKTTKNSVDEAETPKAANIDEIIDDSDESLADEAEKLDANVSKATKAKKTPSKTNARKRKRVENSADGAETPKVAAISDEEENHVGDGAEDGPSSTKKRRPSTTKSADERLDTRLKNLRKCVHHAGLFPPYKKLFNEVDGIANRIKALEQFLVDKGIDRPITLEKCQKYKAKREIDLETESLSQNLVFEVAAGGRVTRSSRKAAATRKYSVVMDDDSDSKSEEKMEQNEPHETEERTSKAMFTCLAGIVSSDEEGDLV